MSDTLNELPSWRIRGRIARRPLLLVESRSESLMHLSFLIAAYAVVWLGLLLYVTGLARRSRALERELEELRELLSRQQG